MIKQVGRVMLVECGMVWCGIVQAVCSVLLCYLAEAVWREIFV